MAQIKSFNGACKALKLNAEKVLPNVSSFPAKHRKALLAHAKLVIIAEALNEGWQPNWNDSSEWKYYPWFEIKANDKNPAGFWFSGTYCDCWGAGSGVGSRLCFRTRELALYAGKQFASLYKDYFLIR